MYVMFYKVRLMTMKKETLEVSDTDVEIINKEGIDPAHWSFSNVKIYYSC